jgi:hypothetical protein
MFGDDSLVKLIISSAEVYGVAMDQTRPVTAWAVVGLISAILGWLAALPSPFIDYNSIVGAGGVGILVQDQATFCLSGR